MRVRYLSIVLAGLCLPWVARAQSADPPPDNQGRVNSDSANRRQNGNTNDKSDERIQRAADALRRAADQRSAQSLYRYLTQQQPTEKGAWIGLSVSSAAPALAHQMRLPEGTGLVVDFVQPKSPSQQAGIRQYDLLVKLDDQLLINPEQFAVLVRTFKPGDEIKLTLLREGNRQVIPVHVAERELPRIQRELTPTRFQFRSGDAQENQPSPVPNNGSTPRFPTRSGQAESTLHYLAGPREITVTTRNGHSTVSVYDSNSHRKLFDAPIDDPKQVEALPPTVRELLDSLKVSSGSPDQKGESPQAAGEIDRTAR